MHLTDGETDTLSGGVGCHLGELVRTPGWGTSNDRPRKQATGCLPKPWGRLKTPSPPTAQIPAFMSCHLPTHLQAGTCTVPVNKSGPLFSIV